MCVFESKSNGVLCLILQSIIQSPAFFHIPKIISENTIQFFLENIILILSPKLRNILQKKMLT